MGIGMTVTSYPIYAMTDPPELHRELRSTSVGAILEQEGAVNDLIFHINRLRREREYSVTDVIEIVVACGEELWWAIHWNRITLLDRCVADRIIFVGAFEPDLFTTATVGSPKASMNVAFHSRRIA